MEQDFYKKVLLDRGINVMIPDKDCIDKIHGIINKELILGKIEENSRKCFQDIIASLKKHGAEGVILGCTEIGLLVKAEDSILPVYDTALLHVKAAAEYALNR